MIFQDLERRVPTRRTHDAAAGMRSRSTHVEISDRAGPLWTLNAANTSWAADVELAPKTTVKLKLEADSEGMALLTQLRSGVSKFMRIKAVGDVITGIYTYLLQTDLALKVTDVSEFSDEEGVFAIEWTFEIVYDSTWTKALEVTVQNTVASL